MFSNMRQRLFQQFDAAAFSDAFQKDRQKIEDKSNGV